MSDNNGQAKSLEAKLPWCYNIYKSIKDTPLNLTLLLVSAFVFYKVVKRKHFRTLFGYTTGNLPRLQRDFTVRELMEYNGNRDDGRILVAVNFNVYDVSSARHYYGEEGVHSQYAGCDISRNLLNLSAGWKESQDFDDLSDLTEKQLRDLLDWNRKYRERYPLVGHLVRDEEHVIVTNGGNNNEEIGTILQKYKM